MIVPIMKIYMFIRGGHIDICRQLFITLFEHLLLKAQFIRRAFMHEFIRCYFQWIPPWQALFTETF
jgi:hypothetical protein